MKHHASRFICDTPGPGLHDITAEVRRAVAESGISNGLLTVYIPHTSASLTIQENADPDVRRDLDDFFARLVSRDTSLYRHTAEGPDDMPAHIRAALTQTSIGIPVEGGHPALGTWQGLYLFEHRDRAHRRKILLTIIGE